MKLTHPERVLWPVEGFTKRHLADYLAAVASLLLPYIAGRPVSLLRAPDGIDAPTFFQRHAMPGASAKLATVRLDDDHQPYLRIDSRDELLSMAQISAIELHPWNCAPDRPEVPGRVVLDLDPGPGVAFAAVIAAARELRDRLRKLGLIGFCKTTGGKGLHVVVPLSVDEALDWDTAKLFTQTLCAQMAADQPELYVTRMTKSIRPGRIYLDYLRNSRTATAVAAWSPRARPGALVSTPLPWSRVRGGLDPARFTIATVPGLVAAGAAGGAKAAIGWEDYDASARPLRPAIAKLVGAS